MLDESLHELGNSIDLLLAEEHRRRPGGAPWTLAQRVRHIRVAAGLTHAQLAHIAHVTVSILRNIETRRHRPTQQTLQRLLPALNGLERAVDALTNATPPIDGAHHP